ncbi:MAG: hypothetical protein BVN28_10255 [Nitrospira sp. ST-bin4]|jgi:predicted anti-sigma-YlaC factor YlaD|uniref:anti-sigma factor family protein n=1 Tax=Nitrospira cf. moscoviensis SBR1015 TaxID=96242 RepID=UPI000A0DB151|nr:zf-HC2 domain-containing protein [Nitrospira cf. moscoviensis SBR1015]MBY0248193.1 zf-HC2 domain-containing protein [Nitrospiraceae bacterium]OQW35156.1 MAG: hypothetical protein A4E20_09775 [Nitrospira sp. SG-bin2]OQW59708.1 MAG: hypothetical protein BVN28_10255 [Nitrospira sp. ST-bin4]
MTENNTDEPTSEITCREVAEWTSAYLDAHAGEDRNLLISLHLAGCAGCEAYVKQIACVRDLVGSLPETAMIPTLSDTLRQALAARRRPQ